ncbi:Acyl-CoA thioester hydrolase [Fusarium oxysporum f. sp. albedinis]|nr:Acyl-CoA thioester hydrolase [Fusarium oxysporum f. sp. albedinis]
MLASWFLENACRPRPLSLSANGGPWRTAQGSLQGLFSSPGADLLPSHGATCCGVQGSTAQHSTAQRIVHCASHTSGRLHRKLGVRRQMQVIVVHTGACRLNDNGV